VADQKHILIIDDDPDFLDYITIILSANGYQVHTATNASDGLQTMRESPPDLVVLDMMISYVLDGWTVSREMRFDPHLRDIPVMMVSAIVTSQDDELFAGGEVGRVDAFMSKPLEPSELLSSVARLIQTSQGRHKEET